MSKIWFRLMLTVNMLIYGNRLFAQFTKIDTSISVNKLIDKILVGNGIRVGNVKITGLKQSIGYFKMDSNLLQINSGIIMSTGSILLAAKGNNSPGLSGICWDYSKNKKFKSDKDLNLIAKSITRDQIILEFDFVPFDNHVEFNFAFASEEYEEYVGSEFNDVFAFILTGRNIKKINLAVLPDSKTPITINNINHLRNKNYYISNDYFLNYGILKKKATIKTSKMKLLWNKLFNKKNKNNKGFYTLEFKKAKLDSNLVKSLAFDGFTKKLKASCILTPWNLYHLKIALADIGDAIFDSGVFLEEGSFRSYKDSLVTNFINYKNQYNFINWDSLFGNVVKLDSIIEETQDSIKLTINFDFDKFYLTYANKTKIDSLIQILKINDNFKVKLIGYTDATGSNSYNVNLSKKRAQVVKDYLIQNGISEQKIVYSGLSFENPIANNNSENGRAQNRRVELLIIYDD